MRVLLLVVLNIFSVVLTAQLGFIDSSYNIYYSNLINHEDTLILAGVKFGNSANPSGILFSKLDTSGNIISSKIHYGKNNEGSLLNNHRSRNLIRFSDNSGYLFIGTDINNWANNLFWKFDNDGNILWEKQHFDPLSNADHFTSVLEVEDGFMLAGRVQLASNLNTDPLIIKISKEGEFKWRKTYGTYSNDEVGMGLIKISSDTFVLFGNYGMGIQTGSPGGFTTFIDQSGNELKRWKSPINQKDCCIEDLHVDDNGNYIHISRTMETERGRLIKMQPIIIIRDSSFNILQKNIYADTIGTSYFERITPAKEGGWIAVGRITAPTSSEIRNRYSWIMRLDREGKEIWSTQAALFPDSLPIRFMQQDLHQVVELSSGSIVASGNFEWRTGSRDERGFLLKVDKNGCWDTIPCRPITSNIEIGVRKGEVQVYPNPTSDTFGVYFSDVQGVDIQLFNAAGQLVLRQADLESSKQIEVGHLPMGLYFYQIQDREGQVIDVGKIVIEN